MVASKSEDLSRDDQYVLNWVYHTKTFKDGNHFHRRIIYICDRRGDIVNNVGLPSISSSVDVPVKFYTLEAESTNNRITTKKQRKASGFLGTIEAIRAIDAEQQEDFAMAVAGLHEDLQLRKKFEKFKRPDFLELSCRERDKFLCELK